MPKTKSKPKTPHQPLSASHTNKSHKASKASARPKAASATDALTQRLAGCYTGVLHDVMRDMGLRDFVLPPTLRPLDGAGMLCGPAYTVFGRTQPCEPHESLLAWTGLLSKAEPGCVLVMQPNDRRVAFMGELSAETLHFRGLRGVVVDGACRDTESILKLGFPVWATHHTPLDIVGYWKPEQFQVPVRIGEVTVHPGDIICADRDGVVVVPSAQAEVIATRAEAAINKENLVRKAILQGVDPQEAYRRYGKF